MTDERMKELQDWSLKNYRRLDESNKAEIRLKLDDFVPSELFDSLMQNVLNGDYVFEDVPLAHFGVGMGIRNLLREVLPDDKLPPVVYEGGMSYSNWDDYYVGALVDWLEWHLDGTMDDDYEMIYVIARPLNGSRPFYENGNIDIYPIRGHQVLHGTLAQARDILEYVKSQKKPGVPYFDTYDQYKIYEVTLMEIT
jgi:hypothetical protein